MTSFKRESGILTKVNDYGTMTVVMQQVVSKSQFKAQMLSYLRDIEKKKSAIVITHDGKPVAKVIPYQEKSLRDSLRGTVVSYEDPTKPVDGVWEAAA